MMPLGVWTRTRTRTRTRIGVSGPPLWALLLLLLLVTPGARSSLNEEQEELLVELHNYYRGQVSPSAAAMMPLRWDPTLKVLAEGYAAKCIWNHNPDLEDTGENLYAGTGTLDLREALEKWFLERLDYDFQNNSCDEDKMCGHYTQMVWADTHRVGCAIHLCDQMEGLGWPGLHFLVCNYYPPGNYDDERPYLEGDWCSKCPENLQNCENSLCVADKMEEEEEEEEEEEQEEDGTSFTPPATTEPFIRIEEEEVKEEEAVAPPPATSEPPLQTKEEEQQQEEPQEEQEAVVPPPVTTTATEAPETPPPGTPAPPNVLEEEEEERKEGRIIQLDGKEVKVVREVQEVKEVKEVQNKTRNIYQKTRVHEAAGSAAESSPSLLLLAVTALLAGRRW